jgi:hypothetical protein
MDGQHEREGGAVVGVSRAWWRRRNERTAQAGGRRGGRRLEILASQEERTHGTSWKAARRGGWRPEAANDSTNKNRMK